MIVGVKQHDILTYRIARSVKLFWAPFLTQNLVLVFAQVNIKECDMLITKMSCFRSTVPLLNPKALYALHLSSLIITHVWGCYVSIVGGVMS